MTEKAEKTEYTVADALIEVRESRGLTPAEAAQKSGVPKRYIDFFERRKTNGMTADVYAHHKLRAYSRFLDLDEEKVLSSFRQEQAQPAKITPTRHASRWRKHPLKNIPTRALLVTPKIIRGAIAVIIAVGIGMFFVVRAQKMTAPPQVALTSPKNGLVTEVTSLTVEGKTEKEVRLLVNGEPVYIDSSGNFSDELELRKGLNVIRVVAMRKHGQKSEVVRRVIVKPEERSTASLEQYNPKD